MYIRYLASNEMITIACTIALSPELSGLSASVFGLVKQGLMAAGIIPYNDIY